MNRAPLRSRARLRALVNCCAMVMVLAAAGMAYGASDGLAITGLTQWAAIAGHPYTFTPTVINPTGRRLVFAIVNKPAWVTLDTSTGRLSGTPPNISKSYHNISITVTDGHSTVGTAPFFIRVYPQDTPDKPLIAGTPVVKVGVGTRYAFRPSARDVYGQQLSFSVKNKPAWASFSIATGLLYGTPASGDVGSYDGVEISVTNGGQAASLPPFTITVGEGAGAGTRNATLSWQPPTENTDGSTLTDLAGTRIYYGTSAADLSQVVEVPGAAETSYTIADLSPGTWYFALAAYTVDGTESAQTALVSATVP